MEQKGLSTWLKWLGLIPAGLFTGLWLIFGVGEVAGGDLSGITHLVPAGLMILLVLVAWKWQRAGGLGMLLVGVVLILTLLASIQNPAGRLPGALLTGGPFLVSGILFFLGWMVKRD